MNYKLLAISILAILATGCVDLPTPPLTVNYSPSSTMTVEGEMRVGNFRYIPGEGGEIKPNQIRNTHLFTSMIFEKNINEYIETALFTESRFVGIELTDSAISISGEINEFLIDHIGSYIDWTLDIRYVIRGCYDKSHKLEKRTGYALPLYPNMFGSLKEVVKLNIEMLFRDPVFHECIKV